MKFDKNYLEILSQINKELKSVQISNDIKLENGAKSLNKDKKLEKKRSIVEKENDFVNKSEIKIKNFIKKSEMNNTNIKNFENISNYKLPSKSFENPRKINNNDTLPFTFDNHERHLTEEKNIQDRNFSFQNETNIKLKTFKMNISLYIKQAKILIIDNI